LGFALEEAVHVNVWKNRLAEQGLPVGPWLHELKRAVMANEPDDHSIRIISAASKSEIGEVRLGELRDAVTITPGQKIAYVTDAADTPENRAAIVGLARDADILFIEATFAQDDAALATERAHLTTTAAGEIARAAEARRVEPFHFSRRYEGDEQRLLDEVMAAFGGPDSEGALS
jgi:ribonuclease Z